MSEGKTAIPRVTYAEQAAREFLYWGFNKPKGATVPMSYTERVGWVHRWPNVKWSDTKLIDFSGSLCDGTAFLCEVKSWDTRKGHGRFIFSRITEAQYDILERNPGYSYLWLGAIVPSQDRRAVNWRMFLIPWPDWTEVGVMHRREFKDADAKAWKSISLEWVVYWLSRYELTEWAYRTDKGLQRAWFTQYEMQTMYNAGVADSLPMVMPLPWRIPRNDREREE